MSYHSKITNQSSNTTDDHFPIYPTRASYNALNATTQPVRTTAVVVKHKSAKQYDPDAVARLKEKLGLSRNSEEKKKLLKSKVSLSDNN